MMKLFEPIIISGMKVANRVVLTTIVLRMATEDGLLSSAQRDFYIRVAQGGTGMLVIEGGIEDYRRESRYLLGIYDDKHVPDLKNMVDQVHSTSHSKIGIQLMHILKKDPISGKAQRIEDLRNKDIMQIVEAFGKAAERAKKVGFDFVEIHAAHGLTLGSILSLLHKRDDEYGPPLENRIQVVEAVIHDIRRRVGNRYPIGIRINGEDFIPHGNTLKQATSFSLKLAELQVAYISVSAGGRYEDAEQMEDGTRWPYGGYSGTRCMPLAYMPNGVNVYLAATIKEVVKSFAIPVITAGKIPDPASAEKILEDGKADLVGMARPILCDQEWVKKARENRWTEIAKCMYCGFCNDYFNRLRKPVSCSSCTYPTNQCPAGIDIPRLHYLISERRFNDASKYLLEMIPFPSILGRLCFAPCEELCRQKIWGGKIPIRALHRFIAEKTSTQSKEERFTRGTEKRIAVVGSGPAGLTAAYYLARMGYDVTIFEALPEPGGILNIVPPFRLPKDILNSEISRIVGLGVKIMLNSKIESFDSLLEGKFHAIFLALGSRHSKRLGIEGEEAPGVMNWLDFLTEVKHSDGTFKIGRRVCVIGVGNTACDVARVAVRLGAERVAMKGMEELAFKWELEEAIKEGIEVETSVAPKRIIREGNGFQVSFIRMKRGGPDFTGRPMLEEIPGSEFQSRFDSVIVAIGQIPDIPQSFGVKLGKGGIIDINTESMVTSTRGVFAGGDVVTGEGSIIEGVTAGKKAALSIDKYLGGNREVEQGDGIKSRFQGKSEDEIGESLFKNIKFEIPSLHPHGRGKSFEEVELSLTQEAAVEQAQRCWRCDRYHVAEK